MKQDAFGYMPICFNIRGKRCLVVGGGNVAYRKIALIKRFGANVICISPEFIKPIQALETRKNIKCIKKKYPGSGMSLKKYELVISATDDPEVNIRVARNAFRDRTLVNVVDKSIEGTVIMPAILKKKGLLLSVSTGGSSPSRAKKIRDILKNAL